MSLCVRIALSYVVSYYYYYRYTVYTSCCRYIYLTAIIITYKYFMYAERGPIIILYSAAPVFPAVRTWAYSVAGRYNTTLGRYCIGDKNLHRCPLTTDHTSAW